MSDAAIAGLGALVFSTLIGIEGPEAATAPAHGEMVRIVAVVRSAQPVGQFHEGAEQGGAIVVHHLDQAGFLYQAA